MPQALMNGGTRKLSDVARHVVVPAGVVTTGYPAVRDKCRDLGIVHDDWQQGLGRLVLAKRADGKYAATVGGVVISIPRQVGKTFVVGSIIFALCLLFPGLTVLWTAHRARTSNETFRKMQGMAGRAKVKPHVLDVRRSNGEQEITFRNRSRIMFGAREQGFGLGFDEVDIIVFDEAQILTEKALEDMVATTNQSRQHAGALLFYMGTPPRPIDPGEVFSNKRAEALSGESTDSVYVEMSADPGADPDDRAQVLKANPSVPNRTPWESVARLRANVGSAEAWLRAGLGIWDADGAGAAVPSALWLATADESYQPFAASAFAVEADILGDWSAVSVAGPYCTCVPPARCDEGVVFADLIQHGPDTAWIVPRCVELADKYGQSVPFLVDKGGPAAHLIPALRAAGLEVVELGTAEVARSYSLLREALKDRTVRHGVAPPLEAARKTARTRRCGDGGQAFGRVASGADISPLVSLSFAHWAAVNRPATNVLNSIW